MHSEEQTGGHEESPQTTSPASGGDFAAAAIASHDAVDSFAEFDFPEEIEKTLSSVGWAKPTPVQGMCLPHSLKGRDVAGFAQTGTGKTGVFLLTTTSYLLRNPLPEGTTPYPRVIMLAPTRELAVQIEQDGQDFFNNAGLQSLAVYGGIDYDKQAKRIKQGVDVIVATPGRLKDYCKKKLIDLEKVSMFVCDEADRMFDMGFIEDVEFFLERIPEDAQKLLFSATTNDEVKELAFEYLNSPEYVSVTPEDITPERIVQVGVHCNAEVKLKVILGMLREHDPECAIIFTNTKLTADWLHFKLSGNGIDCDLITGDLPQKKRIRLIQKIKEGKIKALIATDVASRGLHISRVTHVYNFDLPDEPANYVHRIGRTARAGAKGFAYSLVCDDYGQNLSDINELLGDVALKTEWYDEKYLEIQDNAGNPYAKKESEPSRSGAERGDRGDRDSSGGGRQSRGRGRGRGGKGRDGDGRNRDQDDNRRQAKGGGGRNKNRKRGGQGGKQRDRNQQRKGQPQQKRAAEAPRAAAESKSTGGLLKKIVKTIFGRK